LCVCARAQTRSSSELPVQTKKCVRQPRTRPCASRHAAAGSRLSRARRAETERRHWQSWTQAWRCVKQTKKKEETTPLPTCSAAGACSVCVHVWDDDTSRSEPLLSPISTLPSATPAGPFDAVENGREREKEAHLVTFGLLLPGLCYGTRDGRHG
jgi:hypothetical protein